MGAFFAKSRLLWWTPLFLLSLDSRAEFNIHLGSQLGGGRMGNVSGAPLSNRAAGTFSLQAAPGYKILPFVTGALSLEYRLVSQLRGSDVVGNDVSGSGYTVGPAVILHPGPIKFLLGYDLWAKHGYSSPDTSFSGSGWRFLLGYQFIPTVYLDLAFSTHSYGSRTVSNVESDIGNDPLKHWNFGLGASLFF